MKKLLKLVLTIFSISFYFSQVNIEEVKKNVTENPQKYYIEYLEVFKNTPEKLTQEQLNYIYYGNNYIDLKYNRSEFNKNLGSVSKIVKKNFSKKLAQITLEKALLLYEKNSISKELLLNLVNLYNKLEDKKKSQLHFDQYQLLLQTIKNSGTGLLEESPIVVTSFSDKFLALEQFSKIFTLGIDFKTQVLPDGSWLDIFKNGMDLFFIKTVHHKDMFKDE